MRLEPEGARGNPTDRFDGLYHLKDRQLFGSPGESDPAADAASHHDQTRPA
jgi:hypothetical protein